MNLFSLPLFNWTNGVVMIGIFALVCVILIAVLINFMASGKKDNNETS
jgi:hypothetical protein